MHVSMSQKTIARQIHKLAPKSLPDLCCDVSTQAHLYSAHATAIQCTYHTHTVHIPYRLLMIRQH